MKNKFSTIKDLIESVIENNSALQLRISKISQDNSEKYYEYRSITLQFYSMIKSASFDITDILNEEIPNTQLKQAKKEIYDIIEFLESKFRTLLEILTKYNNTYSISEIRNYPQPKLSEVQFELQYSLKEFFTERLNEFRYQQRFIDHRVLNNDRIHFHKIQVEYSRREILRVFKGLLDFNYIDYEGQIEEWVNNSIGFSNSDKYPILPFKKIEWKAKAGDLAEFIFKMNKINTFSERGNNPMICRWVDTFIKFKGFDITRIEENIRGTGRFTNNPKFSISTTSEKRIEFIINSKYEKR